MNRDGRPRIFFFVGPSLSAADIYATCEGIDADVLVLPPIEQGDVLRVSEQLPDVIGIVDGYFFHVPAVLHREILFAIERGVRVLGASSVGALRAAELDVFGMEGVGEIYQLYRRGVIDGDDEVAVLHSSEEFGFRPLTEALVNIRHNLRRAQRRQLISAGTAAAILARAKRLHFTQRTYAAALDRAYLEASGVLSDQLVAVRGFLRRQAVDLKREDALALVRTIVGRIGGSHAWPPGVRVQVNQTTHFYRCRSEYVGHTVDGCYVPDDLAVSFQNLLSPSFPRLYRRVALSCLTIDEAAHRGLVGEDADLLLARFRRTRELRTDEACRAWLRECLMSHEELITALRERDLEEQLLSLYRTLHPESAGRAWLYRRIASDVAARAGASEQFLIRPLLMGPGVAWSGPLIREMKLRGMFRPALDVAGRIIRHNAEFFEQNPSVSPARIRPSLVNTFFARRWGIAEVEVKAAILERGFARYSQFIEAARQVYIYEQYAHRKSGADSETQSKRSHAER